MRIPFSFVFFGALVKPSLSVWLKMLLKMQLFHLLADSLVKTWHILSCGQGYHTSRLHFIYALFRFVNLLSNAASYANSCDLRLQLKFPLNGAVARFCSPLNIIDAKVLSYSFNYIYTKENSCR